MKLADYMCSTKALISRRIEEEIREASTWGKGRGNEFGYVFPSLADYSLSGKMLRGVLVCLGSSLFNPSADPSDSALDLAAAMELFQSGLLVHDDIMDKDDTRRGKPTIHRLFEQKEAERTSMPLLGLLQTSEVNQPLTHAQTDPQAAEMAHLGESLAICAGDICYFLAWKLVTRHSNDIGVLVAQELVNVCLAQMRDVKIGTFSDFPSLEEILEVYGYKTARYTITLPLCCGALLEKHPEAIPFLEEIGRNLGTLFQLQDDFLGLFGNASDLGKPVGSDIKERKKTPFMILLQPRMSLEEASRFRLVFGNESLDTDDMDFIRNLVRKYAVDTKVRVLSESYGARALTALNALESSVSPISRDTLQLLRDFTEYSLARKF